jgi:hypothetical protein
LDRNWAFQPEFAREQGAGADRDYLPAANPSWDFGPFRRARPYDLFGAGAMLHHGEYGTGGWGLIFGGGFGVRAYVLTEDDHRPAAPLDGAR